MSTQPSPEEIARSHRWHAVECNNRAWQLSEQAPRTANEDQEMLDAAHAAAWHWARVGTELNQARAQMLLGHVHAALGMGMSALSYARQSYDYLTTHETPDWELAFAHATLAYAAFAAGDGTLHQEHHTRAEQLGEAIAEPEDKRIFLQTFALIPKP